MTETITSRQNPLCKHVIKLRTNRAYRYACGEYLADGIKLVGEAVQWHTPLRAVIVAQGVTLAALPDTVQTVIVPPGLMRELSRMQTPQGAIAVCKMPPQPPLRVQPGCLILDGVQDPGNLGTILRTADAWDVPVLLTEGCADPYGEKTVRASMGAVLRTPPVQTRRQTLIEACRQNGVRLCVTALGEGTQDLRAADLTDCAVVIGSEGKGVDADFLSAADLRVTIPMSARCESLNAAVAAAVVMWQTRH